MKTVEKIFIPPVVMMLGIVVMIVIRTYLGKYNFMRYSWNVLGLIPMIPGIVVMIRALLLFRKHKTTVKLEVPSSLVTEGIYSRTRNPIYMGMFGFLMGLAIILQNVIGLVVPVLFILFIRKVFIAKEEKLMEELFAEDYIEYKKLTPRWF